MEQNIKTNQDFKFFASANSYDGFKSYFDLCFNPNEYDRIFILKGGPGTGKSSFMKKIAELTKDGGATCEWIICSSDINSVDGVILESDKARVAVVDGTSPHTLDAKFPCVCETIIDLAQYLDYDRLKLRRGDIVRLNSLKSTAYTKAYSELEHSAIFGRYITAECARGFHYDSAKSFSNDLILGVNEEGAGTCKTRLISSFSKNSYRRLSTLENIAERIYSFEGAFSSPYIMLQIILAKLKKTKSDIYIFPHCLDNTLTEAIYIEGSKTALIVNSQKGEKIKCDEYLCDDIPVCDLEFNLGISNTLAGRAAEFLKVASEYHFKLEDVYTPCMNFDAVSDKLNQLAKDIKNILYI